MLEFEINNYKLTLEPHHIDLYKVYSDETLKDNMLEVRILGDKNPELVFVDDIYVNEEDMEFYVDLRLVVQGTPRTVKLSNIVSSKIIF